MAAAAVVVVAVVVVVVVVVVGRVGGAVRNLERVCEPAQINRSTAEQFSRIGENVTFHEKNVCGLCEQLVSHPFYIIHREVRKFRRWWQHSKIRRSFYPREVSR